MVLVGGERSTMYHSLQSRGVKGLSCGVGQPFDLPGETNANNETTDGPFIGGGFDSGIASDVSNGNAERSQSNGNCDMVRLQPRFTYFV